MDTYIDDGETGSNTDRPGFQRMLQDMRSGRIDCAVSKDLSRFSRNYIDAGNYLEKIFPAMSIRYIAIHDQIEVVLHLDRVLRFIDTLPQRDRRVFSYEAQMTRLEEEIQRYKKLELGLYENFVEGIINKTEYTDFRENFRAQIEEKQEALKRLEREQRDAAAMGSQNRAWVQVFAQYENVQELDRRLLMALVDKIFIFEDKRVEIAFHYQDEFAKAMRLAKNYKDRPLSTVV